MRTKFKPYIALLRQQMIGNVQFRFAFWNKMATNSFFGYMRAVIVVIFYHHGMGSAGIALREAVGIIWLSQIAMNLLFATDFSVWDKIRSGDVGYELLRPIDVYAHWYAKAMAVKLAPFLMAMIPISTIGFLVPGDLGLMPPASLLHLLACFIALGGGLLLSSSLVCLTYAMMMDVRVGDQVARLFMMIVQLFAGHVLPLQLWPEWMQKFLYWQPFAGAMDIPLRFYVGSIPLNSLGSVVLMQLSWSAVMILIGRVWINRNLTKLVVQGG